MGVLFPSATHGAMQLAARRAPRHNFLMRFLFGVLVGAAIFFVAYHFYLRRMPSTDDGTAATQAISLTGVRMDLLQIADAEHGFLATNGHCASLDELISTNSVSMTHTERDGYSYAIQCSGIGFTATARHRPAPAGSPIRYPNFSIDESLDLHEIE
jgi:hypothetical protein